MDSITSTAFLPIQNLLDDIDELALNVQTQSLIAVGSSEKCNSHLESAIQNQYDVEILENLMRAMSVEHEQAIQALRAAETHYDDIIDAQIES